MKEVNEVAEMCNAVRKIITKDLPHPKQYPLGMWPVIEEAALRLQTLSIFLGELGLGSNLDH